MSDANIGCRTSAEALQPRGLAATMRADPTLAAWVGIQGIDSQAALTVARMHQLSQLGGLCELALLQGLHSGVGRQTPCSPEAPSRKLSRTEKKRNREQQRRHEVNEGFDSLVDLLRQIEPKFRTGSRKPAFSAGADMDEHTITNRVDLLDYTMKLLQSLHDDNEKKKEKIKELIAEQSAIETNCETETIANVREKNNEGTSSIEDKGENNIGDHNSSKKGYHENGSLTVSKVSLPVEGLLAVDGAAMIQSGATRGTRGAETIVDSKLEAPLVPDLECAATSHSGTIPMALLTSSSLFMQPDAARTLIGSGSLVAAHYEQQTQLFPWSTGSLNVHFPYLLMDSGVGLTGAYGPAQGGLTNVAREANVVEGKERKIYSSKEMGMMENSTSLLGEKKEEECKALWKGQF